MCGSTSSITNLVSVEMESTVAYAPKILSGIDVIDQSWGGLYRGGSYLVYGRAATGRGLMTMMFTQTGALLEEQSLFISPDRPKDLMIQAASMGFNLRHAYESGLVKLMRIPPMLNLQEVGDEGVAKALNDLVSIIRQNRPNRLVINDFMPFVQFRSFDRFRAAFVQMLEQIDSLDTTLMLVTAEPANQQSRKVVEFMRNQMTGSVHIELLEDDINTTQRRLTLIPNIGHIKRRVVEYWDLEEIINEPDEPISTSLRMLPTTSSEPKTEGISRQVPGTDYPPVGPSSHDESVSEAQWQRTRSRFQEQRQAVEPQKRPMEQQRVQAIPLGRRMQESRYESSVFEAHPERQYQEKPISSVPPQQPPYEEQPTYFRQAPYAPVPPQKGFVPTPPAPSQPPLRTPDTTYRVEPEPQYWPAPELPYQPQPEPTEPEYKPEPEYQPAPEQRYRPEPQYRPAPEPEYRPESEPTYPPKRETRLRPAPEPPYRPEPKTRFRPAPEPSYQPEPEPKYRGAPEPQYHPRPETPPRPAPESPYQPEPETTFKPQHEARYRPAPEPPQDYYAPSEPTQPVPSPHEHVSHTDRDAFRNRLQQHFLRRDVNDTPFLLIAMRMDRSEDRAARPFDFEFILDLVSELLREQDDMFVDLDRERLIVLLADSRPEEAQRFFARLKNRLRDEAPQQADHLLHSVSAIVVPDGRPFQNAEEFLTYALDEA